MMYFYVIDGPSMSRVLLLYT